MSKELQSGAILKVTSLDGSTNSIGVIGGTEEPFEKRFLDGIMVSGSIKTPSEQTYAFQVEKNAATDDQVLTSSGLGITTLTWGTEIYNFGSKMSVSTTADSNFYTAAVTGLYTFSAHVLIDDDGDYTSGDRMDLRFYYGTGAVGSLSDFQAFLFIVGETTNTNQFRSLFGTTQIYLTSGQRVALKVYN